MNEFVLDASVTLSWCFEDEIDRYTSSVLESFRSWEAVVPPLWTFEVVNALATAERRKRLGRREADEFLQLTLELPIRLDSETLPQSVLGLARSSSLSAYDAAYLELASRRGVPLATRDRKLIAAARGIGVEMFQPR